MPGYLTSEGMSDWVGDVEAVAAEVVEAAEAFRQALDEGVPAAEVTARREAVRAAEREMSRILTARLAVVSAREAELLGH